MPPRRLPPAAEPLLALVAQAAFANPFTPARAAFDAALAEWPVTPKHGPAAGTREPLLLGLAKLETLLADWREAGFRTRSDFPAALREAAGLLGLFVVFHRHAARFDRLIDAQAARGDAPLPAPFVAELRRELEDFGFTPEESRKYAGLFHQLRRAFRFISTALVGGGASMETLRARLWSNLFTGDMRRYDRHLWNRLEDYSTLLVGETGTGKGAAAAALGRSGFIPFDESSGAFAESFTRAFVPLNLAECPPSLLESELFGHRKGAFTGALDNHPGVLARCSRHGAIFLDEIGDAAPSVQVKLLRVLQERVYVPVGGGEPRRFAGRVIAATHVDLARARAEGRFRDDFFYRLCSDLIEVPPLRRRCAEHPATREELVVALLPRLAGDADRALADQVLDILARDVPADHPWPGNVRELEQAIRRILLSGHYAPEPGPPPPGHDDAAALVERLRAGHLNAEDLLSAYCRLLRESHPRLSDLARRTGLDRRTVKRYLDRPAR
jgi:transcriptional regulator of acetoin/glycerol metabolism